MSINATTTRCDARTDSLLISWILSASLDSASSLIVDRRRNRTTAQMLAMSSHAVITDARSIRPIAESASVSVAMITPIIRHAFTALSRTETAVCCADDDSRRKHDTKENIRTSNAISMGSYRIATG